MGCINNIFISMKTYTIKLEDKAAFTNALKSIGIGINSLNIKDNLVDKSFEVSFMDSEDEEAAKDILRTHTGIDQLKEYLRRLIREELKK